MDTLLQDFRYALRTLRRAPGFTSGAVLVLAAGIALSTLAFSLVRAYLIRPLPFPDAKSVVSVIASASPTFADVPRGLERIDWASLGDVFPQVAAWDLDGYTVVGNEGPDYVNGAWVSPGFFSVVGAKAQLGRLIDAEDARTKARVAVISHGYWQRRFGGDPAVINRTIRAYSTDRPLDPDLFTIVGVLSPDFWNVHRFTDILLPLSTPRFPSLARLAPGVTIAAANARLTAAARASIPEAQPGWRPALVRTDDEYASQVESTLWILFAAVGCVLLAAGANVAGLVLVRGAARRRELTVRAAIGASRGRVVRQLVVESVVLSLGAGIAGIAAALAGAGLLGPWIEAQLGVPVPGGSGAVRLDFAAFGFAALVTMVVALVVGLRPAFTLSHVDLASSLGGGARSGGPAGSARFRATVIASQVALSFLLLIGAGLMIRTLVAFNRTELGFRPDGLLKAHLLLPQARYPNEPSRVAAVGQALERIQAVPGVAGAAVVMPHPFRGQGMGGTFDAEGWTGDPTERPLAVQHVVAGDYFGTMGIRLVDGRPFASSDAAGAEPVAVVSARLAQQLWPDGPVLGRRIRVGNVEAGAPWRRVIGVVEDVRKTFTGVLHGDTYVPYAQAPGGYFAVLVRSRSDAMAIAGPVQRALLTVAPDLPLHDVEPFTQVIERQGANQRFLATLLGGFAVLTLILALLGLYSVLAYAVSQRSREIAVRVAVGASGAQIASLVVREGAVLIAAGVAGGVAASVALVRGVSSQLYGVTALDPVTFAAAALVFVVVGFVAVLIPARRAALVDPNVALRAE